MKFWNFFKFAKANGWAYAARAVKMEIKKKKFVWINKRLYKGGDAESFSQYAEDLYIDRKLNYKADGFYVDVGANDPNHLNNTKKFYKKGWRGINIEPGKSKISLFSRQRPEDVNIWAGLGEQSGSLDFFSFSPDTLSTFSPAVAEKLEKQGYKLEEKVLVPILTLEKVFEQQNVGEIDFLSIDVEGYTAEVLKGGNWQKYRPKLVCVEGDEFDGFFSAQNYKKIAFNGLNSFFSPL